MKPCGGVAAALQHDTIEAALERGVKLDELIEKSDDLSASSKMFYKARQYLSALFRSCFHVSLTEPLLLLLFHVPHIIADGKKTEFVLPAYVRQHRLLRACDKPGVCGMLQKSCTRELRE